MALARKLATDRRVTALSDESKDLARDVEKLERSLLLHKETSKKINSKKDNNGALWKHGADGKLAGYKGKASLQEDKVVRAPQVTSATAKTKAKENGNVEEKEIDSSIKKKEKDRSVKVKEEKPSSAGKRNKEESVRQKREVIDKGTDEKKVVVTAKEKESVSKTREIRIKETVTKTTSGAKAAIKDKDPSTQVKKEPGYASCSRVSRGVSDTGIPFVNPFLNKSQTNRVSIFGAKTPEPSLLAEKEEWAIKKAPPEHKPTRTRSAIRREPSTLVGHSLAEDRATQSADGRKRTKLPFDERTVQNGKTTKLSKGCAQDGTEALKTRKDEHLFDSGFERKSFEERTAEMKSKVLEKMMNKIDVQNKLKDFKSADKRDKEEINQASREQSVRQRNMDGANNQQMDISNETPGGASRSASGVRNSRPGSRTGRQTKSSSPKKESIACDPGVMAWLKDLKLKEAERYMRIFAEHEVDMEALLLVTEDQLKEMGIRAVGAYNKILIAIRDLKREKEEESRRTSMSSRSNTIDVDDPSRRLQYTNVQATKTSLLRKNVLESKQRHDESRKPWMNPNRNGTVRSRIDTGLTGNSTKAENKSADYAMPSRTTATRQEARQPTREETSRYKPGARESTRPASMVRERRHCWTEDSQVPGRDASSPGQVASAGQRATSCNHHVIRDIGPGSGILPKSTGLRQRADEGNTMRRATRGNPDQRRGDQEEKEYNHYEDEDEENYTSEEEEGGAGYPQGLRVEIRNRHGAASASGTSITDGVRLREERRDETPKMPMESVKVTEYSDRSVTLTRRRPIGASRQSMSTRKSVALPVAQFGIMGAGFTADSDPGEQTTKDRKPPPIPEKPVPHTQRYPLAALPARHATSASDGSSHHRENQPCNSGLTSRSESGRKSNAEVALQTIEAQLVALQTDPSNDPVAVEMINRLQLQLQELQEKVYVHVESPRPVHTSPPGGPQETLVKAALAGNLRPRPRRTSDDARSDSGASEKSDDYAGSSLASTELRISPTSMKSTANRELPSGMSSRSGSGMSAKSTRGQQVLSANMEKQEILREVRKQKEDYRRQIRHLESELSRLKHKDPLRHVDIPQQDVTFDEADLIGEGAFSQVFRGLYHGSDVAIKRLKIPLSQQDKNYFTAEVSLLQELRHPRVVLLLGVCMTSHLPLMVLDYMPRGSLYHHLHDTDAESLDHVAYYQIARDMALGMNYLHQHRPSVLHLDLKSMNVLLTQYMRAKIADFGFSKLRHDAEKLAGSARQGVRGTPAWMAPELLDSGDVSPKADVYSFSVILWEMLTRQHPYQGCSLFQVIEHVRKNKRPEIPSSCPKPLRELITKAWHHNPIKRIQFKEIIPALEKMHFPKEWRSLFAAAGVPPSALEDIESTRTLVDLITNSVDHLHEVTKMTEVDSGRGVSVSPPQIHIENSHKGDSQRVDGEACQFEEPKSSSKTQKRSTTEMPSVFYNDSIEAVSLANKMQGHYQGMVPPPPPPPPPPVPPAVLPAINPNDNSSFMEDIKSGLKNVRLKPIPERSESKCSDISSVRSSEGQKVTEQGFSIAPDQLAQQKLKLKHSAESGPKPKGQSTSEQGFYIDPSDLLSQKQRLKHISRTEPNQLTDLSKVSDHRLHSIADILKKALSGRRLAVRGQTDSIDQSCASTVWSISDDY